MKKILFALFMISVCITMNAQQLTLKSVSLKSQDAHARTNPRDDGKGGKCAIIRVCVVGEDNLVFPEAVGDVERSLSEYIVYVPEGLKTLTYKNKEGVKLGTIDFDGLGLEIGSMESYEVIFDSTNHLRSAVFNIQPTNASLTLDGEKVEVGKDGIAMVNKPVGKYTYMIEAKGFLSQSGSVVLTENDISTVTDIVLEERLYPVSINVFPRDAKVFIDDVPIDTLSDLKLPEGKHTVRVTATNYQEEERTIRVSSKMSPEYFILKDVKDEVVVHKEEQNKTNINIRNAFYLTCGLDGILPPKSSEIKYFWGIKGEFSFIHHFGGIFAIREGIGVSFLQPDYEDDFKGKESLQDSITHFAIDIPIQIGVSIPLGKHNNHLFTVLGGGYGHASYLSAYYENVAKKYREILSENHFELKNYFDFGLRASLYLDIFKFTVAADVSQSLNGHGFSGSLVLGIKLYTLKRSRK